MPLLPLVVAISGKRIGLSHREGKEVAVGELGIGNWAEVRILGEDTVGTSGGSHVEEREGTLRGIRAHDIRIPRTEEVEELIRLVPGGGPRWTVQPAWLV